MGRLGYRLGADGDQPDGARAATRLTDAEAQMISGLDFKVLRWSQSISKDGVRLIRCICTALEDLPFEGKEPIIGHEFQLEIVSDVTPDELQEYELPPNAIGRLVFTAALKHGFLNLPSQSYATIWDQIRVGGYVACKLSLEVERTLAGWGGPAVWKSNPLPIFDAELTFEYLASLDAPTKPTAPKGWFYRPDR